MHDVLLSTMMERLDTTASIKSIIFTAYGKWSGNSNNIRMQESHQSRNEIRVVSAEPYNDILCQQQQACNEILGVVTTRKNERKSIM